VSASTESAIMSASSNRKTIFITGAGSGIGRATAILFASRGWFCGLADVASGPLEETVRLLPDGSCWTAVFDVRDRSGWSDAVSGFGDQTGGRMHLLFNNAGIGRSGWFEEIPQDDADLVVDVNLKGVINGVYASLPLLEKTPGARVVNVASTAGVIGAPRLAVYSATKFAVLGLSEALDAEFAGKGIRVVCLAPWFIDTPILDMGATEGANRRLSEDLKAGGLDVYPVELAAEKAWEAAHTEAQLVMAGKAAEKIRFMRRFFPGMVKANIARGVPRRQ
jgi:NAD(P)-dependent dehydrogenase (short-subunit alcohol dehydrogenase family)